MTTHEGRIVGGPEARSRIAADGSFCRHPSEQDEEIRKIQAAVSAGMSAIVDQISVYRKSWDKYKGIWVTDKDSFVQRYGRLNVPVSSFDADLNRFDHFKTPERCCVFRNMAGSGNSAFRIT